MKASLQTRVSLFVTLLIVAITIVSTVLFTTMHLRSKERGMIARGNALSFALARAADEGLLQENLDLIKKASAIVRTADVTTAMVYSSLWEPLDAYPLARLQDPPHPDAIGHFQKDAAPFWVVVPGGVDFYSPILFSPDENASLIVIGYARILMSSASARKDVRNIVLMNLGIAAGIMLLAIISINVLIRRVVVTPVMSLYRSVAQFRSGELPDLSAGVQQSAAEIRELSQEFERMFRTIREKEERLVASEGRIRALFDRVEHAIFRLDRDGNIIEANSRFRRLFGNVTALCDIMIGEQSATDCLGRAVRQQELHIEDSAVGQRGEELVISLSLYPEKNAAGEVEGFDGYILDLTEKKRLEERLIRSQKMEAVGTLAGGMAHDFNNLLTAIFGYAEILLSMTKEGDPYNKPATIIYDAAKRGADFGRKILSITRKEKLQAVSVDLNEIVRNSIELLQRSIPKTIEIVTVLAEGLPRIKADPSQLQQVILNLAVNARDAMPAGGRMTIETSLVGAENGAASTAEVGGGRLIRLSVADTGVGIDTVTQRKIFDPFFTTKDMGKGTGLGLYIVHSIVNNHGGYINLYSEPLKGTQFNIYLPVTAPDEGNAVVDIQNIRGEGTILVIDDEADVRELCRDILEPLGYSVLLASSGMAGINIYREMKDSIALVILDMIMPKMGGTEVFQALRTIEPAVKVLLCSGYSQNGFAGIDELLRQGAGGFIQKPFSRMNIGIAIKKALGG